MKIKKILLIIIFLLAFVLRLYKINEIRPGITDDEAGFAYDSFLILQSGRDQWGKLLPLQFRGFGDYRLPLVEYILVPFIGIFGLNNFAIRFPFAFFGASTVLMIYFLIKEILNNSNLDKFRIDNIALLASLYLAINPWHIGLSRTVHEMIIAFALVLGGFYLFLKAEKKKILYFAGLLAFVIAIYTYYGVRIFTPLFILIFLIWERKFKIFLTLKKYLLVSFILLIPALFSLFSGSGTARFKQVNILNDIGIITTLNEHRGTCLEVFSPTICKIFYNRPTAFLFKLIQNYFSHFSFNFLFSSNFTGANSIIYGGLFYFIMFPLFFIGLKSLYLRRNLLVLLFFFLTPLADSLTDSGHYGRSFLMIFPIIYFSSIGTISLIDYFSNNKMFYSLFAFLLTGIILLETGSFYLNYLSYFPKMHSYYTHYEYQPLFEYLKKVEKNYDHIYISKLRHDQRQYIFYLYYFQVPTQEYFNLVKDYIIEDNGWIWVTQLGKFHFINQADRLDNYPAKSLLVIDRDGTKNLKEYDTTIATIKYLNKDTAFNIYDLDYLKQNKILKEK